MVEEALLKDCDVIADRSDIYAVTGVLDNETAAEESDVGAIEGEVDNGAGIEETEGEPSADASSRNATADGSDILRLDVGKEL